MANTHPTIDPSRLVNRVIAVAMVFNNLREIKPNRDFDDPATPGPDRERVERLLSMYGERGWQPGWAHCAAFVDSCYCEALRLEGADKYQIKSFTDLMQLGVVNSIKAFKRVGILTLDVREPGSIWLAQHGDTPQGHTGIVTAIPRFSSTIKTIEANTSKDANPGDRDREGDWITVKVFPATGRGSLRTRGFVSPTDICRYLALS